MAVINTNISSINAQRNLSTSQNALQNSLQRLSSGLRINSAKDDAAGLAIATRMTGQIEGLQQASRNANDGISLAQTAEGAMGSISDILTRMRTLAVQSSNGSNSKIDRTAIQNEVDQLYAEIDRISATSEFNGVMLLNGTAANNAFQVGANANQTISFSINEVSTKAMSLNGTVALGDLNSGRVAGTDPSGAGLKINGKAVTLAATDITAELQAKKINAATGETGVTATAYNTVSGTQGATGKTDGTLQINGTTVSASANMTELVDNINKQVGGVTAAIGSKGELVLSNDTGANITFNNGTTNGAGTGLEGTTLQTKQGYLALKSGNGEAITVENGSLLGFNKSTGNSNVEGTMDTKAGATATQATAALNTTGGKLLETDKVTINGYDIGETGASAAEKAAAINAIKDKTGVTASANTAAYLSFQADADGSMTINGTSVEILATDDSAAVVAKINAAGISGVVASTDGETGKIKLEAASGSDMMIGADAVVTISVGQKADVAGTDVTADEFMAVRGQLTLQGENGATVTLDGKAESLTKLGLVGQGGAEAVIGGKLNVATAQGAQAAITAIDKASQYVSSQRSTMGAVQNRLTMTISNLSVSVENLSAARSRIQDADFASETATMTKNQILQQAGTAMLAQANQLPQMMLSLLQ